MYKSKYVYSILWFAQVLSDFAQKNQSAHVMEIIVWWKNNHMGIVCAYQC